jgi:hypothetical protein
MTNEERNRQLIVAAATAVAEDSSLDEYHMDRQAFRMALSRMGLSTRDLDDSDYTVAERAYHAARAEIKVRP